MLSTSTSQEEGCNREWSILSKEFTGDEGGNVTGAKIAHLNWEGGKFTEIPGTDAFINADFVFSGYGVFASATRGNAGRIWRRKR